jgi:cytochrome c nitrite reductase small subunit
MQAIGITLALLAGLVLGLGLFTFQYAEGLSYFSSDPAACANCHIMNEQYDSWQKASHHGVAKCIDCHLPHDFVRKYLAKAENGYFHSKGFTFQDFHEPIMIKPRSARILQENCVVCHEGMAHELVSSTTVSARAPEGAPQHARETVKCVHCHASVGHGPVR